MKKSARMHLFFRELAAADACNNATEAYLLLKTTLNGIEDEHSGTTHNPAAWQADGRLYMPQDDNASTAKGFQGVTRYRSVAHATLIAENGAFMIHDVASGKICVKRAGADGRHVSDFATT